MGFINDRYGTGFTEYAPLYQWSVENIPEFWAAFWEFAEIKASKPYDQVIEDVTKMPGAKWFSGARLSFAENLLRFRDDQVALIFKGEDQHATKMTYAALYDEVARVAKSLKATGVQIGDRVAGFLPNMPETIAAMLAATSLGAVWSSCSPDFGIKGVLDRFGQIKPKVLFTANGYWSRSAFLPDGRRALLGSPDGVVLWDTATGEVLHRYLSLTVAAVAALVHLRDKFVWGILPASCMPEILSSYGAQIAAAVSGKHDRIPMYRKKLSDGKKSIDNELFLSLIYKSFALGFGDKWS